MKSVNLTEGKVFNVLLMLALPIMGSSAFQFAYSLIDMLWVGRLGSDAVASVGAASFLINMGYAINALVVIGTGIKVAYGVGRKATEEVVGYISTGIVLNAIIAFIYTLVMIFGGRYFIGFLNLGNTEVEQGAMVYLLISAPMMFFAFSNALYTRIFGSFGNNQVAFKISLLGIILNIIMDPIFIFTFELGILGAGLANLIANMIMFVIFIYKGKYLFKVELKKGLDYFKMKEIMRLGFPMAFQRVLFTFINIILARVIATFGSDAIAAQKIALQIESISYMILGGLSGAVANFTGQNYGAKKYERVDNGYKIAIKMGVVYTLALSILFFVFPNVVVEFFIEDESTITIASAYLQFVSISLIFSAMEMVTNGLFTGLGIPKVSSTISIILTALRIPMALIFMQFFGVNGVWLSISISSILKGMVAFTFYRLKVMERYEHVKGI